MNVQTQATLTQLEQAVWFSAVGRNDISHPRILTSWEEALASCTSDNWQHVTLSAQNALTMNLFNRDASRFN
jgi:hypothetical protein